MYRFSINVNHVGLTPRFSVLFSWLEKYLFVGSDKGGARAAAIYTLIQTARLNFVDPEVWLRDVLTRIAAGHPANRIGELTPWEWTA